VMSKEKKEGSSLGEKKKLDTKGREKASNIDVKGSKFQREQTFNSNFERSRKKKKLRRKGDVDDADRD